jgi:magnesium-dependent phosphatase-1
MGAGRARTPTLMPRVKLVILDLDKTVWDHPDPSLLREPLKKVDSDTVVDSEGVEVHLYHGVRETLEALQQRGVVVSVASWNRPEVGFKLLGMFGIERYLRHPKIQPHPAKHLMIRELLEELKGENLPLRPEEILYVDDRTLHLEAIRREIGNVRFLQMGVDIRRLEELIRYIDSPDITDFSE